MSIPTSLDKIKIQLKNPEESSTNLKTLLLPKFYSYNEIMNLVCKICANNRIKNKLKKGRDIEELLGNDFLSILNKKRKEKITILIFLMKEIKKMEIKEEEKQKIVQKSNMIRCQQII